MNLSIKISRLSNFLFFIQKTDNTSVKLDLKKYFSNNDMELLYYEKNDNKIWEQIKKTIGKQNQEEFKKNISPLEFIFAKHWNKEEKILFSWKKYFQDNKGPLQQIIFDIEKLSGIKNFKLSQVPIYLISDPSLSDREIHAWFSWTPEKSFMVVEIPHRLKPTLDYCFPISILAHEFFHLMIRENKALFSKIDRIASDNKELIKKLSNNMPPRLFVEELLVSSFIPEGYLSEKYFNNQICKDQSRPKSLLSWRKLAAFKLRDLAKIYIDRRQCIDNQYLKNLMEVIKQK